MERLGEAIDLPIISIATRGPGYFPHLPPRTWLCGHLTTSTFRFPFMKTSYAKVADEARALHCSTTFCLQCTRSSFFNSFLKY